MSGEKSPRVHKHIEINAFMAALCEGACYVRRAGRMTCTRPAALNYPNPRAHWPKVSEAWGLAPISIWALKGATKYKRHDIVKSLDAEAIGPLRGPIRFLLAFPRPHEVSDLCALGLPQVKTAGLVQASWPAKLSPDNNNCFREIRLTHEISKKKRFRVNCYIIALFTLFI